ncbi:MAG TPA: hypothetical protein VNU01_12400 [Egibacteraceae bacterium]|nr:hypothetical protein [Egibacteraceae bacterium]
MDLDGLRWEGPLLAAVGFALLGVAAALVVNLLVRAIGRRVLRDRDRVDGMAAFSGWIVLAVFLVVAIGRLADPDITEPGLRAAAARSLGLLPDVLIAVLLVAFGVVLATALRGVLRRLLEPVRPAAAEMVPSVAYWAVVGLALLLGADQIGVETGLVVWLLVTLVGGVVLAFALALGLGAKDLLGAVVAGRHVAQIVAVGDEVEVDGKRGTVVALGHASVRLSLAGTRGVGLSAGESEGVEAEVPNRRFLEGTVLVHRRAGG